jgi:HD superfamily phosphohydrolase YqeK
MKIDRKRVLSQFAAYTRDYDPGDPKIALKIAHTYRVADYCEKIAGSIGLSEDEIDFSWLSGMLHDIGRFEQVRRYHTFIDSKSVDHAEFGADLLFVDPGMIGRFTDDRSTDELLSTVIRQHNKFRIKESVTGKDFELCNILRDADKIDIFRVTTETPLEDIYNISSEELLASEVTEPVMEQLREHHAVLRSVMKTPADHVIGHIALVFELVYPISRKIVREQGYVDQILAFPSKNIITLKALEEAGKELEKFYNETELP